MVPRPPKQTGFRKKEREMENTNRVVRMRGVSDRVAVTGPIEDNEAVKNQNLYESRLPVPSLFGEVRLVAFASTKREGER